MSRLLTESKTHMALTDCRIDYDKIDLTLSLIQLLNTPDDFPHITPPSLQFNSPNNLNLGYLEAKMQEV